MNNDYAGPDRQAFLHPPQARWVDSVVGHVIAAVGGALTVIVLLGERYAG